MPGKGAGRTIAALFSVMLLASGAHAGERYYVLLFGSQRTPPNPNYSHSFATFVRVTWPGDGPCPPLAHMESHTISWLPENMIVRTLALFAEPGKNFDLHTTLRYVLDSDERVSLWGPYEIAPKLYQGALDQINLLESGQVRYKANDTGRFSDRVTNCIHAIGGIMQGNKLRVATPGWGEMASWGLLKKMRPFIIDRDQKHYQISATLGLNDYPIIYREWENPRSGGVLIGPLFRMFGGEDDVHPTYGPPQCPTLRREP